MEMVELMEMIEVGKAGIEVAIKVEATIEVAHTHAPAAKAADVAPAKIAHGRSRTARGQRRRRQQYAEAFHIILLPEGHFVRRA